MAELVRNDADAEHPLLSEIARRWSPYGFDQQRLVETEKLLSCLEAARWAASSFNEQPWRFILATRDKADQFAQALSCLVEANQDWAKHAGALILTAYAAKFSRNGKDNRTALHDLGLAVGNLSIEATRQGLHVHQMAGVNLSRVRAVYGVPEDYEPATAIAIGYALPAGTEQGPLAERDATPRKRKHLQELVFSDKWASTSPMV